MSTRNHFPQKFSIPIVTFILPFEVWKFNSEAYLIYYYFLDLHHCIQSKCRACFLQAHWNNKADVHPSIGLALREMTLQVKQLRGHP